MPTFHFLLFGGSVADDVHPLPTTFDLAYARLEATDGVFIEPDGSFSWTDGKQRLEGQMFDQGNALNSVEIRGATELAALQRILGILCIDSTMPTDQLDSMLEACAVQCNLTGEVKSLPKFLSQLE